MSPRLGWVALAAAALAVPAVTTNTYYLYLAMTVAILGVVTSGLNVLAGLSGQISLGHAGLYAVGAYAAGILATRAGLGLWSALPVAVAVTAAVGAGLALAALRVSGPYLAMVTIAFGIIVEGALIEWVALTGGPGGIFNIPRPRFLGTALPLGRYYLVVLAAVGLAVWLTRNLGRSAWGRAFVAVKDSEIAAESLGLSTYVLRTVAFTVSAAFAGAGGALFAFLNGYLSPDSFTLQTSILFLLIVLFGGLGTLAGPLVGAVVLVLLPELLRQFLEYRLILYGALLLGSVYFLPRGVVGGLARWAPAPRRGQAGAASVAETRGPGPGEHGAPGRTGTVGATGGAGPAGDAGTGGDSGTTPAAGGTALRAFAPPAAPDPVILAVEGLSVAFGGVRAVNDVRLRVERGTIHSLIGPNGAGKTTLVNLLTGFSRPDRGRVAFRGRPITGLAPAAIARRGLLRTFQTPQLFDDLTVADNVLVGVAGHRLGSLVAASLGRWRAEAALRRRAAEALGAVGLEDRADTLAAALPFGLRRRLEIGRALGAGASMLLLDEPAAGLSATELRALDRLLDGLRGAGLTILLIEHHIELVMAVSDCVTVLDEGAVIAEGRPAEVQRDPRVVAAYLGIA